MKKLFYFIISFSIILSSCSPKEKEGLRTDNKGIIDGLATPFQLAPDTSTLRLTDYIVDPNKKVDSIYLDKSFDYKLSKDKKSLKIWSINKNYPMLSVLKIWHKNTTYAILLKKNLKEKITITYKSAPKIKDVKIKGEFNAWNPDKNKFTVENGVWKTQIVAAPGRYAYVFIINGKETIDPLAKEKVSNGMGGYNSILNVGNINPKLPKLYTNSHKGKDLLLQYSGKVDSIIIFWQNYQLSSRYYSIKNKSILIKDPFQVNDYKRSYYRVWAYNSEGISNDLLIPLQNGHLLRNAANISRKEKYGNIIYNIMIDRFVDGDTANTKKLNSPEVLPKVDYYGGDLQGINDKIVQEYFSKLNINSLWISPIIQNPWDAWGQINNPKTKFSGYHGYWPISSTQIDKRFGNDAIFKTLIADAHAENINIFLDYVANHVHQSHPLYKQHPDWTTALYLPDGTKNTQNWDSHRLTTWFDDFLPTLDFSKPEVVNAMTDSALFWLNKFDLDGFRHDATKHIQLAFWRTLTYKIKKQIIEPKNRVIYQIGETYGSPELINSYVNSGELDGQFDFNVYDAAISALAIPNVSFENLKYKIEKSLKVYGNHNLMGYITGNQDKPRFISLADGSVAFDEDSKLAGWKRKIEVKDTIAYYKLSQLTALMASIPGIPVIFYGDEFGMPGANDPDCRRMMRFGKDLTAQETATLNRTKKIFYLRKHKLPLIYGDTKILRADETSFVVLRQYFDKIALLIINKSSEKKKLKITLPKEFTDYPLKSNFNNEIKVVGNKLNINIKANYFDILTN